MRIYCNLILFMALMAAGCAPRPEAKWWKGNLHTHTLRSDGDEFPEVVVEWYKSHGYHFLALSDHNVHHEGPIWKDVDKLKGGPGNFNAYRLQFGDDGVDLREEDGRKQVRLKGLSEYRECYEEPGRFLLIPSEEITDHFEDKPVHVNGTNLVDLVEPQGGNSVAEVIRNNVRAVLRQREATGQPMIPHLNHPNFRWAVTAEDMLEVPEERFFEVYNGHPGVRNYGDD